MRNNKSLGLQTSCIEEKSERSSRPESQLEKLNQSKSEKSKSPKLKVLKKGEAEPVDLTTS